MTLIKGVRQTDLDAGAALVGFAPIERFYNAPQEYHPRTIYPSTKTAIAHDVPQSRGAFKAVVDCPYWQVYNCDAYRFLNEVEAPSILRRFVMTLEKHGYTSMPWSHGIYDTYRLCI